MLLQPDLGWESFEAHRTLEGILTVGLTSVQFVVHVRVLFQGIGRIELRRTSAAFPDVAGVLDFGTLPNRSTATPFRDHLFLVAEAELLMEVQGLLLVVPFEADFALERFGWIVLRPIADVGLRMQKHLLTAGAQSIAGAALHHVGETNRS